MGTRVSYPAEVKMKANNILKRRLKIYEIA